MVIASDLRPGMVIRFEGQVYKVLDVESKSGAAKMGGVVKASLSNLHSGRMLDQHFRPQERLEDLELERHNMEFLYSGDDGVTFMNPVTFDQVEISHGMIGAAEKFLTPQMTLPVEFFDGKPVGVELPQTVDLKVIETEPGLKSATASSVTKPAKTETGLVVQVPPFINEGEIIRVDTSEGAYLSRA